MDIIQALQDKNNQNAYQLLLELETKFSETNELYPYFEEFLKLIEHKNSFVRVRGFRLCCAQTPWDVDDKMGRHLHQLLTVLEDEKPAVVRQCLAALHSAILRRPKLGSAIEPKLKTLNPSKYPGSMCSLIEKDIERLRKKTWTVQM